MGAAAKTLDDVGSGPWRQGSAVAGPLLDAARARGWRVPALSGGDFAFIISQDCDVVHHSLDEEPYVDLLVARCVEKQRRDGNYFHGKNPRRYQFELQGAHETEVYEVWAAERFTVERGLLREHTPSATPAVPRHLIRELARWTAKRYRRAAFPDEFNRRVQGALQGLTDRLKATAEFITGIYLRLDPHEELPANTSIRYRVLVWVTATGEALANAQSQAKAIAAKSAIFQALANSPGIQVLEAKLVGEHQFTLQDLRNALRWDYDYLSLRGGDEASLPVGE